VRWGAVNESANRGAGETEKRREHPPSQRSYGGQVEHSTSNVQHPTRNFQHPTKLILNAFSFYFVIGHSVLDIGYSSLKLIAMWFAEIDGTRIVQAIRHEAFGRSAACTKH
jgi:hypothetical protein